MSILWIIHSFSHDQIWSSFSSLEWLVFILRSRQHVAIAAVFTTMLVTHSITIRWVQLWPYGRWDVGRPEELWRHGFPTEMEPKKPPVTSCFKTSSRRYIISIQIYQSAPTSLSSFRYEARSKVQGMDGMEKWTFQSLVPWGQLQVGAIQPWHRRHQHWSGQRVPCSLEVWLEKNHRLLAVFVQFQFLGKPAGFKFDQEKGNYGTWAIETSNMKIE